MLTILVANIKGGCGKTTVATHLAAASAAAGLPTVLADVDRQRSSLGWLERRPDKAPVLVGLDWGKDFTDTPRGTKRLVIDAPAALKTKQIEDLVKMADVVVLPVLPGAFDEQATQRFLSKLDELKRIARKKTMVAVVGNRMRARTKAADRLDVFLGGIGHQVVTRLRDSQIYADAAATGLSLFDMPGKRAAEHRGDWQPLLTYIDGV
ncbi:plasmid partitioning protein ParA [Azospirillum thiophilum]|uniref:Chromosome partitioning protein ParA n=1 Tax=Azospirillum thiophilum TaxID=528244 RepID=A0AAC8VUN8_9PROT|nr:ParA family protein [Azospirillum thiophilum]ALG69898.1 chromosome partitioning protein ParA [Azospirillum thiophilum]KJR66416.1 plasmid partitioning protein ParA [Azospirillum thiophilum]